MDMTKIVAQGAPWKTKLSVIKGELAGKSEADRSLASCALPSC